MKGVKAPVARKESIEKVLEEIFNTIELHNKTVLSTKKELKHKVCHNYLIWIFISIAIIQLYLFSYTFGIVGNDWAIVVAVIVVPIAYEITKNRYCIPYYQNKKDMASIITSEINIRENELSELLNKKVTLFNKECIIWDECIFIGDGSMHQDDYYSELYGGIWTEYAVEIDGKLYSFNPYRDITYT